MQTEKKQLNLFNIIGLGLGGAIGSGIFVMLGQGIGLTGRSIFLSVILGCVVMLLAYFFHPVLSSMFVFKGGDYDMKNVMFPPTLAGVNGLLYVLQGFAFATTLMGGIAARRHPTVHIERLMVVALFVGFTIFAVVRLKMGAVNVEELKKRRDEVLAGIFEQV